MYDENLLLRLMGDGSARPNAGAACPHGARPLAMVYAPLQEWRELYDNEVGFSHGTIFKELDFPFLGGDVRD